MVKKIIKYLLYRAYVIGKTEYDLRQYEISQIKMSENAIIDSSAIIEKEAIIQNSQNDRNKILIGSKTQVKGYLMLFKHGGEIRIGDYSFIGPETKIWSAKKITIGNRVLISHNVNIHDNISHPLNSKKRHEDYLHILEKGFQENVDLREEEIVIEDDVWIGFNSTILKGVRIGKGAIVGACTIITEDVPPYAVVIGNPPRIIKYVD